MINNNIVDPNGCASLLLFFLFLRKDNFMATELDIKVVPKNRKKDNHVALKKEQGKELSLKHCERSTKLQYKGYKCRCKDHTFHEER